MFQRLNAPPPPLTRPATLASRGLLTQKSNFHPMSKQEFKNSVNCDGALMDPSTNRILNEGN